MHGKNLLYKRRPGSLTASNRARRSEIDELLFGPKRQPPPPQIPGSKKSPLQHERVVLGEAETANKKASTKQQLSNPEEQLTERAKKQLRAKHFMRLYSAKQYGSAQNLLKAESGEDKSWGSNKPEEMRVLGEQIRRLGDMAKVLAVREKQLALKQNYFEEYKSEEKKKDLVMEVERLKQVRQAEDAEERRRMQMVRGREDLMEQIRERDLERIRQQEELERENVIFARALKQAELEERRKQELKAIKLREVNAEIEEANDRAVLIKLKRQLEEEEEELKIKQYNDAKEQTFAAKQALLRELVEEREKEVQKLRDKQKKQKQRQNEQDAMRAQRDFELKEKELRAKERASQERRLQSVEELRRVRDWQLQDKSRRQLEEKEQSQREFSRKMEYLRKEEQFEKVLQEEHRRLLEGNRGDLLKQIEINSLRKQTKRLRSQEEMSQQCDQKSTVRAQVSQQVQEKLRELRGLGVEERFLGELKRLQLRQR